MNPIITFLTTLDSLSPLAVIALLGTIIFMLVKGKTASAKALQTVQTNHLHELPEMADTLRRIETRMAEYFTYIKAKIDGRP